MKNTIQSGNVHVVDKSNQKVNLQGTFKYAPSSDDFTNGNDLRDQGNIHVNKDGGGYIGVKFSGDTQFHDMYLAQGVHPYVVKAVQAPTAGTPVLIVTDILIIV